ncbi:hypothetical protein ALP40_04797 [Pseudomonas viridiflava]|uniref:Uncharacterized protein n=1 Tax=Pseudomonas viridiflava TaxID=33069 RepID=A0A3M5PB24_PSEVI|nr:hypothetical protein ALP40_04797 [Pseudomonas viridiflava]
MKSRFAVPQQQGFVILYRCRRWQAFKCVAQPRIGLLSQYKAHQQSQQPRLATAQFVESAVVWQWDRKRTYIAEWSVAGNQIDDTSVCRNWRRGSIEYRECRKGAKVYFKEQCKRLPESGARQRYCSKASGFSPLG